MLQGKKNIVLIVIDTLRADHLELNNYFRKTAPNLTSLSKQGVNFSSFFASAIATGPAFSSIYTGLHAINHEFYATPWNIANGPQLDDNTPTVAEIFQENDYTTAAVDNLLNFRDHPKHFVKGFEYYMNPTKSPKWDHHHVKAESINRYAINWLKNGPEEPFFLLLHYWDPHMPYNQPDDYKEIYHHEEGNYTDLKVLEAPDGYKYVPGWGKIDDIYEKEETVKADEVTATQRSVDLYDGEINYVDEKVGDIVNVLQEESLLDKTNLLVTSDHGEQLGQHGVYGHVGLHDSVISVPLLIRSPKMPSGRTVHSVAQHHDLLPTMMDLAGIEEFPDFSGDSNVKTSQDLDGNSLVGAIKKKEVLTTSFPIFLETTDARAIRTEEWKLINPMDSAKQFELYQVNKDPMEVNNLAQKLDKHTKKLNEKLLEWIKNNIKDEDPMKPSTQFNQPESYTSL